MLSARRDLYAAQSVSNSRSTASVWLCSSDGPCNGSANALESYTSIVHTAVLLHEKDSMVLRKEKRLETLSNKTALLQLYSFNPLTGININKLN